AATCKDDFTLQDANGQVESCVPYKCVGGVCQQQCQSGNDCAAGYDCQNHQCIMIPTGSGGAGGGGATTTSSSAGGGSSGAGSGAPSAGDGGGCGCRTASRDTPSLGTIGLMVGIALALGRRKRRGLRHRPRRRSSAASPHRAPSPPFRGLRFGLLMLAAGA